MWIQCLWFVVFYLFSLSTSFSLRKRPLFGSRVLLFTKCSPPYLFIIRSWFINRRALWLFSWAFLLLFLMMMVVVLFKNNRVVNQNDIHFWEVMTFTKMERAQKLRMGKKWRRRQGQKRDRQSESKNESDWLSGKTMDERKEYKNVKEKVAEKWTWISTNWSKASSKLIILC